MGPDLRPAINVLADNCYVNDSRSFRNKRRFGFQRGLLVEQVMDSGKSSSSYYPTSTEEESCIKNTMQMHERIFKQQVKELHRLYGVQKLLMGEVKKQQMEGTATLWSSPLLTAAPTSSSDTTSFINLPNKQIRTRDPVKSSRSLEMAIDDDLLEDNQVVELTLSIGRKMDGKRCIDTKLLDSTLMTDFDQGGSVSGSETETCKGNREEEEEKKPFLFL